MLGVMGYGHYGRPVLAMPAEGGDAGDWERMGMVDAVGPLLEGGRIRLFTVDARSGDQGWRSWIVDHVVPHIHHELGGAQDIIAVGPSMGAFQAVELAMERADLFPLAIGLSGNYFDLHERVAGAADHHVDWLRSRLSVLLVVGQGLWEDSTQALPSTRHLAGVMRSRGIRCELDEWGYDVPHDWPSWRAQIAHHLPRFC
jgi:esterase/lipase superfamily enzyme